MSNNKSIAQMIHKHQTPNTPRNPREVYLRLINVSNDVDVARDHSMYTSSQWETALQHHTISH